jgi:phosphatidylinositol alpha-1,6-mannosyltransferase
MRFGLELASRRAFDRPDWILFSHLGLARLERFLPNRWACPYGVFLHGIECWSPLSGQDIDVLNRANVRIANSSFTARRAAEVNPGLAEIAVCPLALPEWPRTTDQPQAGNDDGLIVLVVGRLSSTERYKGHEQLIQAWPLIQSRVPRARLVIAGDGDDLGRLKSLAANAGRIEFTGFLSRAELDRLYADAALFALPSRGEGFGLVYLEAMASGLACIGSVHDAASEVIVDGHTGRLVDPSDVESMSKTIADLLDNPGRLREMGQQGRTRVLDTFSYERFRARVTGLLESAFAVPTVEA